MSNTDELIAGALRDLAAEAVTVPPAADALWRAGRHRRLSMMATSAAAVAGAVVITLVLALTVGGRGSSGGSVTPAAPVVLRTPILFGQVAATSRPPCRTGAAEVRTAAATLCMRLTGTGMTVQAVRSALVQRTGPVGYLVDIRLMAPDSRLFAALTRELAGRLSPHNQLAIIAGGRVLARVTVDAPTTNGEVEIVGFATRTSAENLVRGLIAH